MPLLVEGKMIESFLARLHDAQVNSSMFHGAGFDFRQINRGLRRKYFSNESPTMRFTFLVNDFYH